MHDEDNTEDMMDRATEVLEILVSGMSIAKVGLVPGTYMGKRCAVAVGYVDEGEDEKVYPLVIIPGSADFHPDNLEMDGMDAHLRS